MHSVLSQDVSFKLSHALLSTIAQTHRQQTLPLLWLLVEPKIAKEKGKKSLFCSAKHQKHQASLLILDIHKKSTCLNMENT